MTMVLGGAKIQKWKHWEDAIINHQLNLEKTSIGDHKHIHVHLNGELQSFKERAGGFWRKSAVVGWTMSFFKQFHASVTKADYIALRSGFIMRHCKTNPKFDFHKYLMRRHEADFKKVVGISWYLWLFVVIFLLLDVDGWHTYFWLSFFPLILLLVVGAKLEHTITRLAQDATVQSSDDPAAPWVKPSDEYFWFHRPGIVLYLIHFILFENSFEIAFFFWILWTYGFHSCIMGKVGYIIPRLVTGVFIQVLCSYSTLPFYVIVTQMGDLFKLEIFEEVVQEAVLEWAERARKPKRPSMSFGLRSRGVDVPDTVQMQTMVSGAFQIDVTSPHNAAAHNAALEGGVIE